MRGRSEPVSLHDRDPLRTPLPPTQGQSVLIRATLRLAAFNVPYVKSTEMHSRLAIRIALPNHPAMDTM